VKELEKLGDFTIIHTIAKKPAMMIDKRDLVLLSRHYVEADGTIFIAGGSYEHKDAPAQESPVRADIPVWGYILAADEKDANVTNVIYVVFIDPKGWIPKPIINAACTDQAMNIKAMRDLLEGKKEEKKKWGLW